MGTARETRSLPMHCFLTGLGGVAGGLNSGTRCTVGAVDYAGYV